MLWSLLTIFAVSTVVQSDDHVIFQIMVDRYIQTYSFLSDINPSEIVNSITLDQSIIGTGFNQYETDQILIETSKSTAIMHLELLKQNYRAMIDTNDFAINLHRVTDDICNASKILVLPIQRCQNLISRYLPKRYIQEAMKEDFIKIRDHLMDIMPPQITDVSTLKEHINSYIVLNATDHSIAAICDLAVRQHNAMRLTEFELIRDLVVILMVFAALIAYQLLAW